MKNWMLIFALAVALSSCLKGEGGFTCTYNECAFVAPAAEVQAVQDYLTANSLVATKHCSGMYYNIDQQGTGTAPSVCNSVVVTYEGRLTNGSEFDKSTSPVAFNLQGVIPGFRNGLPLVRTGGKITLYVPPSLGYGSQQVGNIPPNSILIFKVDLLGVQ